MTVRKLAIAAVLTLFIGVPAAHAQDLRGFVSGGVATDPYGRYPAFGGGALIDAGQPWLSVGAQGEALVAWPYTAGRGALFAQGNLAPKSQPVRPFLMAGYGFGEMTGTIVGGGVELRSTGSRLGLRLALEDHTQRYGGPAGLKTDHRLGFRIGVVF
jgi:hypothetical protein